VKRLLLWCEERGIELGRISHCQEKKQFS
jgi:hypothetical protein